MNEGTLTHDLVPGLHPDLQFSILSAEFQLFERVSDGDDHPLPAERLLQEVQRPRPDSLHRRGGGAVAGHDDDWKSGIECPQLAEHLQTVHSGHLDVEYDQIWTLTLRHDQPLWAVRRPDHLVALVLEDHPQGIADRRLIIDHENARLHGVNRRWPDRRGGGTVSAPQFGQCAADAGAAAGRRGRWPVRHRGARHP